MLRDEWLQLWDGFTQCQAERDAVIAQAPESDTRPISRNGWITEQIATRLSRHARGAIMSSGM